MPRSLTTIPTEIFEGVIDYLPRVADLSRLTQTSRSLHQRVLHRLYKHVSLAIPLRPARLRSFHQLLSSTEGMQHIQHLSIIPKQNPIDESCAVFKIEEDKAAIERDYLPWTEESKTLNNLVRELISKIPKKQLASFRWNVLFLMESETLELLQLRHKVIELSVTRCQHWGRAEPDLGDLSRLEIGSSQSSRQEDVWQFVALVRSHRTVTHLQIGNGSWLSKDMEGEFEGGIPSYCNADAIELSFKGAGKWTQYISDPSERMCFPRLKHLQLYGIDLRPKLTEEAGRHKAYDDGIFKGSIAWSQLVSLTLAACEDVSILLRMWIDSPQSRLDNLEAFTLSYDGMGSLYNSDLDVFLIRISPLKHLHVLLADIAVPNDLEKILKVHGSTLQTLVWDERPHSREVLDLSQPTATLERVARYCPNLEALGFSWNWKGWRPPEGFHDIMVCKHPVPSPPLDDDAVTEVPLNLALTKYCLPRLKTLHIRTCPEILRKPHDFRYEDFYQALIEQLYSGLRKNSNLTAVALNPLNERYDLVGSNTWIDTEKSLDYTKFRLYHTECVSSDILKPSLIARGVCDEAEGTVAHLEIFRIFWQR